MTWPPLTWKLQRRSLCLYQTIKHQFNHEVTLYNITLIVAGITFDFTNTPGYAGVVGRIEVVMFNCPDLGIGVQTIRVLPTASIMQASAIPQIFNPSVQSCDSL